MSPDWSNNIFITNRGEIEDRLDPFAYSKGINGLKNSLKKKYGIRYFSEVIDELYRYPTFFGIDYKDIGIPVIKGESINKDGFIDTEQEFDYIDETTNSKFPRTQLEENDLVFTVRGLIGKVGIFRNFNTKGNINANVIKIKIKPNENSVFYWFYLNSSIGKLLIEGLTSGQVQKTITVDDIKNIQIPAIQLNEQIKISTIVEKIFDDKRKADKKAVDIIKGIDGEIAKRIGFDFPNIPNKNAFGVSIKSFENRLDPHFYLPSFKGLIDNIRLTKNAQLGDLVEFSKETWNQKDGFENDFPYIEISEIDLSSGKINNVSSVPVNEAPSRARMVVRENDIIVSTTRPHRGAISLIDSTKDGFIASTGFVIIRTLKTNDISKEYLFYILRTQICLQQMLQRSSGGSYPAITGEELKNIFIPIPSKAIQSEIVKEIKASIEKAEKLKDDAKLDFEKAKMEIEALILG